MGALESKGEGLKNIELKNNSSKNDNGTSKRRAEIGSSLIEVVVTLAISVVLLGAVLSVTIQQGHHRKALTETNLAMSAALNTLEGLRSVPQAALPSLDGTGFDVPGRNGAPGGLQPMPGDPNGLPGRFSVVTDSSSGGVKLYRVRATVTWKGIGGRKRIQLQALIGDRK